MFIPTQVQAQSDKADEFIKAISHGEQAADDKKADPNEDRGENKPESGEHDRPPEETVDSLKQKLAVLQGKYNAEVAAIKDDVTLLNSLKSQLRQQTQQVSRMVGQLNEANLLIDQLRKQIVEKPKETGGDDIKAMSLLSEEDRKYLVDEGFDEKVVEIVGRMVKSLSKKETPAATVEPTKPQANAGADEAQNQAEAAFWREINRGITDAAGKPDWREINDSDMFNNWLDEYLPYSVTTRRDRLQQAQAQLDHFTAIQIFNDFKAQQRKQAPEPAEDHSKPKIDPAAHVEPGSSVVHETAPDGGKPAGKIYTRQEINQFYKDVALGKYKGRDEEASKIDADIIKANIEGRIR